MPQARMEPVRDGFLNAVQLYPFSAGALYQVYTAPGHVTDIALQEGRTPGRRWPGRGRRHGALDHRRHD
jgi:hypothetical protein